MKHRKFKPLALGLRVEPTLHFHSVVDGQEYILPLEPSQARTLAGALLLLADQIEARQAQEAVDGARPEAAAPGVDKTLWRAPLISIN
jgi:hypothetical protein